MQAPHWDFALGSAFAQLERLVWRFDVDAEAGTMGYAGVPAPGHLVTIIDGFLGEQNLLFAGDIRRLQTMRAYIQAQLALYYEAGHDAARKRWEISSAEERCQLIDLTPVEVRHEAWKIVPKYRQSTEAHWFVEGFCSRWWRIEYINYVLSQGCDTNSDG